LARRFLYRDFLRRLCIPNLAFRICMARRRDACVLRKRKPLCGVCHRTSMRVDVPLLGTEHD
jgi:hypothetical protein